MAAIINQQSDNNYIGILKSTASTPNGLFVKANYAAGTATATASTAEGDAAGLLFHYSVNPSIDQELVADSAFAVASGKFLRLRAMQVGDIVTTDQLTGTLNIGDIVAAGVGGKLEGVAARTPVLKLQVIEKPTLYGVAAVKAVVISA